MSGFNVPALTGLSKEDVDAYNRNALQDKIVKHYGQNQQQDPFGKNPHEKGAKLDAGKPPVFRGLLDYFPRACKAVAEVSAAGAAKYAWKGWEEVPDGINRYADALVRHITDESIEGKFDKEGFRHAAQQAWNALARLELILREEEKIGTR